MPPQNDITGNDLAPKNIDPDIALQNLSDKEIIEDGADKIKLKSTKDVSDKTTEDGSDDDVDGSKKARRTPEQIEEDELREALKTGEEEKTEELDETNEEELEERVNNSFAAPPRRKEILAKYPNLFKEFPGLEDAYYRDQQMKNYFSTPAEAKDAVETLQQFSQFRDDLLQGNLDSVFKTIKEADQNSFAKIVDQVLPAIGKQDPNAYYYLIGAQTKATVQAMMVEANRTNDENLKTAAGYLYNFIFRGQSFEPIQPYARNQQQQPQNEIEQQRQQFQYERLETYKNDVDGKITSQLRSLITDNMDRNQQMSDWVKSRAVEDTFNEVSKRLQNDREFRTQLDKYWVRASQNNMSQESLDAIRNFVITRGRQILPKILVDTRKAALQGIAPINKPRDQRPITSGRSAASSNSGNSSKVEAKQLQRMDPREAFDAALGSD